MLAGLFWEAENFNLVDFQGADGFPLGMAVQRIHTVVQDEES